MRKKRKFGGVLIFIIVAILFAPKNVFAYVENPEDLIKKIAPDGKNAILKMYKPSDKQEHILLMNALFYHMIDEEGYYAYGECYDSNYTVCKVRISSNDAKYDPATGQCISGFDKNYTINVKYEEPVNENITEIRSYLSKVGVGEYTLEDLSLINYHVNNEKTGLFDWKVANKAIRYVDKFKKITQESGLIFSLDLVEGGGTGWDFGEIFCGTTTIFQDGYAYGSVGTCMEINRVIYIPENTENTSDAYIKAAQKRINDYLGDSSSVVVSYGGLLSSLDYYNEDIESDGNYYNITINGKTYKTYILKGTTEKLEKPKFSDTDGKTGVRVTSDDSSIPLDASIIVSHIIDNAIGGKIGTTNYKAYDISLYSGSSGEKLEKINGQFTVRIPVPTELQGKRLIVYYIAEDGKIEPHSVTIKDGYAEFTTNHFSTYVLAENEKTDAYIKGDINRDEIVDVKDAREVLYMAVGMREITDEDLLIGDMNANNKMESGDAIEILRIYLKKE